MSPVVTVCVGLALVVAVKEFVPVNELVCERVEDVDDVGA